MKLGILGTGRIVQDMIKRIPRPGLEETWLPGTEHSRERAEEMCRTYGLDGAFFDYEEMLDSDVDTVYVALPNHLHYEYALRALKHGKNVILEKPAVTHLAEFESLCRTADEADRIVVEAMNIHCLPAYRAAREDLARIGTPKIINLNYSPYSRRYDAFQRGENPSVFDPAKAGGALMDLNVYHLHALVGWFGEPESVRYLPNMERGVDTSGILLLDYGSFKAAAIAAKDCDAPTVSTLQGDAGSIRFDEPMNQLTGYELCVRGEEPVKRTFGSDHRMYPELKEMVQMIEEGDRAKAREAQAVTKSVFRIIDKVKSEEGKAK